MLKADQAYYWKKWFAWYIWDTGRDWIDKGWWIENKKWYTERWLESKNNMHWTRFCFASKERLIELWIEISWLSV